MENELNLVKDIIIELSGLGGWAIFAYVVFMLMKAVVIWWPIAFLIHKIIVKVSEHFRLPLTAKSKEDLEYKVKTMESKIKELTKALHEKELEEEKLILRYTALTKDKD